MPVPQPAARGQSPRFGGRKSVPRSQPDRPECPWHTAGPIHVAIGPTSGIISQNHRISPRRGHARVCRGVRLGSKDSGRREAGKERSIDELEIL